MTPFSLTAAAVSLILAAANCLPAPAMAAELERVYSEHPVSVAATNSGALMQIYRSRSGETWTAVIITPKGVACIVAAGGNWRDLDVEQLKGPRA